MKKNKKTLNIMLLIILVLLFGVLIYVKRNEPEQYCYEGEMLEAPITNEAIKNVILMIGDGMGEGHIIAGEIYKGEQLNIQKIEHKTYVRTNSLQGITDSAAAATAMSTGTKTRKGMLGKDRYGNNLENLVEYSHKNKLKVGIVCTQILNHATPAGFSIHNNSRYNYDQIAISQIEAGVELMLGGGRKYFSKHETKMNENNIKWINSLGEIDNIDKDVKVIGTFADMSISKEEIRTSLLDMTTTALSRLENDNGFFLMIEGSDIDSYSHELDITKMLEEVIDFDNAIKIAKEYVDIHPDTLLIVTADHETGGLDLTGVSSREQLKNSLFTTKEHTGKNVLVFAYGKGSKDLIQYNLIDNTHISKFIRQGITNNINKKI